MTKLEETKDAILDGKYTFIGVDIDATGRRILDEIVHIAAYSPESQFDQYIIPVMNLNPAARQRHQLRIVTSGFFRMLKCALTNKVLKSKTEIAALRSFLQWLEDCKAKDKDSKGIVLIYHEPIKFIPYMLLEAFKRYEMLDRFSNVVVAFVDGYALSESKCANTIKFNSLRQLAKLFLNFEDDDDIKNFEGNAAVRARLAYDVVQHLAKGERENLNSDSGITVSLVQNFVHPIKNDIGELSDQNKCLDLQHTFRPVFFQYFKTNVFHRYKAVTFRRVLAEKGYDLKSLENIWNEKKKEGLAEIISNMEEIKENLRTELIDILDSYFDPEKETIVPMVKKTRRIRRRSIKRGKENRQLNNSVESAANGQNPMTPDSTVPSPRKQHKSKRHFNRSAKPKNHLKQKEADSLQDQLVTSQEPSKPELSIEEKVTEVSQVTVSLETLTISDVSQVPQIIVANN